MKKYVSFFLILIFLMSFKTVFAAEIPVADVYSTGNDTAVILSEDGTLFFSLDVGASEKSFITDNVKKVYITGKTASVFTYVHVIKNDGSYEIYNVAKAYYEDTPHCDFVKNWKGNFAEVFNPSWDTLQTHDLLYLDKENNLMLQHIDMSSTEHEKKLILSNVKSYIDSYAITYDNVLYSINLWENETKFVMGDVDSYYPGEYGSDCVLKTNGDVYILSDMPNKVLSNVRLKNGVVQGWREAAFITNDNKLYFSDFWEPDSPKTSLLGDNFNKIIYFHGGRLYAIDKTGNLFQIGQKIDGSGVLTQINLDGYKIDTILKERYISDWGYYLYKQNNKYTTVEQLGVIKNIVTTSNYTTFVNTNGEVWASKDNTNFFKTGLSDKTTKLLLNGNVLQLTQKLQNANGRTMYPFRECLEAMGATVMWDGEKQIAIGEIQGIKIAFPIGKSEYYINGVKHKMDTISYVDESIGRTYIPIRYAAEGLGFTVDWIPGDIENTISIHK